MKPSQTIAFHSTDPARGNTTQGNPNLTKVQIAELQKALPKCKITHNAKK